MTPLEIVRAALARSPEAALTELDRFAPAADLELLRARAYRLLGRHEEALAAFDSAEALAADPLLAARTRIGKIDSLGMLGRYPEALELGNETVARLEALGAEGDAARARCNIGSLYWRLDRYEEALVRYEAAARTFEAQSDALALAVARTNQANALACLGRVEEALPLHEQARDVYASRSMEAEAAEVETNIGYLHHVSGRHTAALAALARARKVFTEKGCAHESARAALDEAEAALALNLWPEALRFTQEALETFARLPLPDDEGRAYLLQTAALSGLNRVPEARSALNRAESIFARRQNPVRRALVRLTRATLPDAVVSAGELQSVSRTFVRYRLPGWAAEARFLQGSHSPRSLGAIRRIARSTHRGWLECRAEQALGRLYLSQEQLERAIICFRRAVSVLEAARTQIAPEAFHVAYLADKISIYEDLVEALLARGRKPDVAEALSVVERAKSRLLLERLAQQEQGNAEVAEARARLARAYREAHALESTDPDDPRRFRASGTPLATLEKDWEAAWRAQELQRSGESRFAGREGVQITELQSALSENEALLIYFATGNELGAFVVNKARVTVWQGLVGLDALRHSARRLRYHLQKPERETPLTRLLPGALQGGVESVLRELFDALLRPLLPDLTEEKLIVVPHGPVHGLPLHALLDGSCPALERWELVTAPSAALWLALTRRPMAQTKETLLLGVPEPGIARVASEVEAIAKIFAGAHTEMGNRASMETLQKAASSLRVLHIATHARFRDDNPLFSGLKLADGWLLARDLYGMKLDMELATLSACQTGQATVEPGDELFGLTRGFLAAGARRVAASLWPADDEATSELMTHFYTLLPTMTAAAALREAQRALRMRRPHPYHWAAFTLSGLR